MHPLSEDYTKLKDAEVEARIQDLSRKYFQTQNSAVKQQIAIFLDIYKAELSSRRAKATEQLYQKRDKDLDSLIKVS
jgi:predicted transcriptional regulator of viral defense system